MTPSPPSPSYLFSVLLTLGVTSLTLWAANALLPLVGQGTWAPYESFAQVPVMTLADPELGWLNRPGAYSLRPSGQDGPLVTHSIGAAGQRGEGLCGPEATWVFGGSFVQGFGVGDGEGLVSVAASASSQCLLNLGVPGYGTVQSRGLYHRLRTELPLPKRVIYGYVDYHEARNVAAKSWLAALDRSKGLNPHPEVPWAELDGAGLRLHRPQGYRHWPSSERHPLVYLSERFSLWLQDHFTADKGEITSRLLLQWAEEVRAEGAEFWVLLLYAPESGGFHLGRLSAARVEVINLQVSGYPEAAFAIPRDGHPNARAHRKWGLALAPVLRYPEALAP